MDLETMTVGGFATLAIEDTGDHPYECPGFSFEALSLSFVRTVAVIAQAERRAVLWGNDLMTTSFPKGPE